MEIYVKLFGTLRRHSLEGSPGIWKGDIAEPVLVRDLLHIMGIESREVAMASVNGKVVSMDTKVCEDDEIILVSRIGAG